MPRALKVALPGGNPAAVRVHGFEPESGKLPAQLRLGRMSGKIVDENASQIAATPE